MNQNTDTTDYKANAGAVIEQLGGRDNIESISNCMTRLRVVVKAEEPVNDAGIRALRDVLAVVHDRPCSYEIVVGPGKCRKYADACCALGFGRSDGSVKDPPPDPKANREASKAKQKNNVVKTALKTLGDIFVPLIPGVIAAGLCAGFASLIAQAVPNYQSVPAWNLVFTLLSLIKSAFMTFITAWVGYRAAERFGATPILGGMLGMITSLDGINDIASILGLSNESAPLTSVLQSGKGGVLAVIFGVLLLSFVEKKIRSRMPERIDMIFTPILSLLICAVPYILLIMPLFGYVSSGIAWVFGKLCLSESVIVRMLTGFLSSALFLPLVATGMHHGLVALYTVQLQELGYITLYPALAMAGAGQFGAALAVYRKAKKAGNQQLCSVISGALPAGFLGVGEPLIYGVTLPLGKPFITAGIGAGFGGALVMALRVASTTWGPSGLLGVFVMTEGPLGAFRSVLIYLLGLVVSYVCSYVITWLTFGVKDLNPEGGADRA